jgi:hypothetical protein
MSTRPSIPVKGITISAAALGATIALLVPMSATAAPPVSQGEGRFLVATIAGAPSTPVAALLGASAVDANGTGTVTNDTPLDATALDGAITVTATPTNLFGANGIVQLGAVGQFAQARDDGSSVAFSGTVSAAPSLVGAGTTVTGGSNLGTPGAGDTADIGLGNPQSSPLSINATIGAVAASAQETAAGAQSGDYLIDNLNLVVGGTTLSPVLGTIDTALGTLVADVNTATGSSTPIVDPIAGGRITISLDDLLAAAGVPDLNALPPGTDLLQYLPAAVVARVTGLLTQLGTAIGTLAPGVGTTLLQTTLTAATGTINLALNGVAGALAPLVAALATLTVNNKTNNPDGSFTQNAITLTVVPGTPSVASVALGNATVGPNAGPTATPPGGGTTTTGTTSAALLADTGVALPVGALLGGAGLLAAAGIGLTRLAAWRRRGIHRGANTAR